MGNVHECFWPFDAPGPKCATTTGGTVSFCLNCNRDHHSGGYGACARSTATPATTPNDDEEQGDGE